MIDKFWYKLGRTIVKAGALPFPITETLIEFLQTIINEDQARFLLIFKKPSLTYEQIKQASDLSHEEIKKMLEPFGVIYILKNKINGKVYVGKTTGSFENRIHGHKQRSKTKNSYLYNAVRKYGWNNFQKEIIDYVTSEKSIMMLFVFFSRTLSISSSNWEEKLASNRPAILTR